ncbi:hypothetical protein SAMN05192558_103237 [Actinokineospora alba]|uniref:Uncharacterized protein n=1 Tax=Actinokineospora alba TaxID=504798 RepID=A0A1H0JW74_9PSEU|nr:hypothetical protein [Actinokineospora alba]TDP68142.1 hypothetical protein C8E96_3705 [Actinokineospora alba]SDH93075.1 hypothetical protein SAMN05421871_102812 [Actinokineospora alba]SDO47809.1 hypothetical protein SAMN05192558_103237 [Actinokineospora alba]
MKTLWHNWIAVPLVRGLTSLPLAVVRVVATPVGLGGRVERVRDGIAHRYSLGVPSRKRLRAGVLMFPLALLCLYLVYMGYLYFLRPDAIAALGHPFTADPRFANAWGGPTLVGAWLAHSAVAFGMHLVAVTLLRRLVAWQDGTTVRSDR